MKFSLIKIKTTYYRRKIGCANYAQRIPNLDELCNSNRLTRLLSIGFEERKNS
jgi:hypothetical protein